MARGEGTQMKNSLSRISIADLIAAPLKAAADAQMELANSTVDFIRTVGIEQKDDGTAHTRSLSFTLYREEQDGTGETLSIQAPLLAIVCGKVSAQATGTRESNQSAKYQIQVKARQQQMPEGLSRVLDILAQSVQST